MESLCHWVVACCVLRNIMARINDGWTEELDDSHINETFNIDDDLDADCSNGAIFRGLLKNTTLETNRKQGGRF